MKQVVDENLALLLPQSRRELHDDARRLTTFLRLLSADGDGDRAATAEISKGRAESELFQHAERRALRAIEDLLRHYLDALRPADSFASFGRGSELQDAWREFLEHDSQFALPAPAETSADTAGRLVKRLAAVDPARAGLWKVRTVWMVDGAPAALEGWRSLVRGSADPTGEAILGFVECLLDAFRIREAARIVDREPPAFAVHRRWCELRTWIDVCLGQTPDGATLPSMSRSSRSSRSSNPSRLPRVLHELRVANPRQAPFLHGDEAEGAASHGRITSRADIGASFVALFALRPGEAHEAVWVDAAPGLKETLSSWTARHEGVARVRGRVEQQMLIRARPIVCHATCVGELPDALGSATRALAAIPVLDDDGEVGGWLHAEWEHHLVPCEERLVHLAHGLRTRVFGARVSPWRRPGTSGETAASVASGSAVDPAVRRVFHDLASELRLSSSSVRWWGFTVRDGIPTFLADGGEGLSCVAEPGAGRGLWRAVRSGAVVRFDEEPGGLAIHADARSGLVLPLRDGTRVVGVWAAEGSRRGAFKRMRDGGLERLAARFGRQLVLARFASWSHERGCDELVFPRAAGAGFAQFLRNLSALASTRGPLVLSGPAGVGKATLLGWSAFLAQDSDAGAILDVECQDLDGSLDALLEKARHAGASLIVLRGFEHACRELQVQVGGVSGEREGVRLALTTRCGLATAANSGLIDLRIAHALTRGELYVPGLCDRREELPEFARFIAECVARREGLIPAPIDDGGIAAIWRQSWAGNLRQLDSFLSRVVASFEGQAIGREELESAARGARLPWRKRLPSLRPRAADVRAALRSTVKGTGAINKMRAASYLGWDPDTLVVRMSDKDIRDVPPAEPTLWGES